MDDKQRAFTAYCVDYLRGLADGLEAEFLKLVKCEKEYGTVKFDGGDGIALHAYSGERALTVRWHDPDLARQGRERIGDSEVLD